MPSLTGIIYSAYIIESRWLTKFPIKNNDFRNRNIISPLWVRGLDYRSKLNITVTQSDPNQTWLTKSPIRSNVFLGKCGLRRFQLKRMILGNRNIILPFWVRGLDKRSGLEFKGAVTVKLIGA
jgi:hypothetical protein